LFLQIFFFQKKKQKAFVLLRRRIWASQTFGEAEPRGQPPKIFLADLLVPEKEAKSVCSASQKNMGWPNLPRSGTNAFASFLEKTKMGWPTKSLL
jgi:hypothetical protein